MDDVERVFKMLGRARDPCDLTVRFASMAEAYGDCRVQIRITNRFGKHARVETLVHELLHAWCFGWSENEVRQKTREVMRKLTPQQKARLQRFLNSL